MNKRIDKLMHKAGAYFGGEGVDYSNFDPKKFAELIVRECAEFADEHNEESEGVTLGVGRELKKHFGVEE